jgi:hypothetical protein
MSKSYRIRTTPGVDKSINILLDQEFEYLEILSLKLLQSDIYTRQCSDYGVIVGRVSVNNGFGIPNAKVSVFIPLDNQDSVDPVISDLYPYRSLSDVNEDGYRYNLLPYRRSHTGHNPTGTFFDREDVLTNPTLIEVFDKYYKYTATTNESGDYMIFGVPVGSQTIVLDVDLSDIGEFSLSPQDLIRMGVATESQVSGVNFKSSTNLRELPQIININRIIQVEPLWGQPEICNLGITRTDFDLTTEASIEITPTAIFMGSIVSTNDSNAIKRDGKVPNKTGYLCSLTTNSGEIIAIRQTIFNDNQGRPILEEFQLEQGGEVIDENGTWLVDVPMNLDFVTTNEFGEQVLSNDPKIGIPTKGKYRFKIKWGQSPSLSDPVKRGYFLVPNIKEYGWDSNGVTNPLQSGNQNLEFAVESYAFSVDWNDYGNPNTPIGKQMIQEAIDCEDRFYFMQYNKVYTVSQFIDAYRKGVGTERYIGIKNILDTECESVNNKFPTNDGNLRFDFLYVLFMFLSIILYPIFFALILVIHLLYFVIILLRTAIIPYLIFLTVKASIGNFAAAVVAYPAIGLIVKFLLFGALYLGVSILLGVVLVKLWELELKGVSVPLLTYPDCTTCSCSQGDKVDENIDPDGDLTNDIGNSLDPCEYIVPDNSPSNQFSFGPSNLKLFSPGPYKYTTSTYQQPPGLNNPPSVVKQAIIEQLMGLLPTGDQDTSTIAAGCPVKREVIFDNNGTNYRNFFTFSLPIADRINLFNIKSKYFNESVLNPGGGVNQISVNFQPNLPERHLDNVTIILCDKGNLNSFTAGQLVTFQNPTFSKDVNSFMAEENEFGNTAITGTTQLQTTIQVLYADPSGSGNLIKTYNNITYFDVEEGNEDYHKFPIDIEYFQVVTGMTYSNYQQISSTQLNNSFNTRYLNVNSLIYSTYGDGQGDVVPGNEGTITIKPMDNLSNRDELCIIILNRGVDPYSPKADIEYGLGKIFGYNNVDQIKIRNKYRLNIPIQGGFKNVSHDKTNLSNNNTSIDSYSNQKLYYDSFYYTPSNQFSGFTSNLSSFYSSLDGTTSSLNYKPSCGNNPPKLSLLINNNNIGVLSPQNRFAGEFSGTQDFLGKDYYTFNLWHLNGTTNGRNRGYFPNEIVEGGSYLYSSDGITENNKGYYSPIYNTTGNTLNYTLGTSGKQIVMRSDRLPTSTTPQENCCNTFLLQKSDTLTMYLIPDDGVFSNTTTFGGSVTISNGNYDDFFNDVENVSAVNKVIESFECKKSVNLDCYGVDGQGNIIVNYGGCQKFLGSFIFKEGCYKFATTVFLSLIEDWENLAEWLTRTIINFAACRNVFSHRFTNNWVNGSLYAFPFKNDVTFTSPTSSNPNQPISNYSRDNLILHPITNNFYYRVSPYYYDQNNPQNSRFVGKLKIKFPTTMMDLGPRNLYIQELVMSDDYDGYVVNKLNSTTFGDVSEILNLFIISRQLNNNFWENSIGAFNVFGYFSRFRNSIDGDYSQLISISSELGVAPFQAINYPDNPPGYQNPIYFNGWDSSDAVIGIFFSSDTQTRDYVSPKRQILNPFTTSIDECSFNNINVFSQKVPMYQWGIEQSNLIFGTQKNDWKGDFLDNNTGLFSIRYQDLDRLNPDSRYFRTDGCSQTAADVGYIYSVSGCTLGLDIDESVTNWEQNTLKPNWITVGAPFHFYFGLRRGASAFDRFRQKWINTEIIVN